jgi:hypothetical protein
MTTMTTTTTTTMNGRIEFQIEDWIEWDKSKRESHSDIMQKLALPTASNGNIILPPRPIVPSYKEVDKKIIQHGVFFAGTGDIHFANSQILPSICNLHDNLNIPDAVECSEQRRIGDFANGCNIGFAILLSQEFIDGPLKYHFLMFVRLSILHSHLATAAGAGHRKICACVSGRISHRGHSA